MNVVDRPMPPWRNASSRSTHIASTSNDVAARSHASFAHHVRAQRLMADEHRRVDRRRVSVDRALILGPASPSPTGPRA